MRNANSDRTAVEIVVETLRQSVERGTLKPGDKLPTLREMEAMYGVSRIVIREAIKVLEGRGLLYSRQGSGIYVNEVPLLPEEGGGVQNEYTLYEIFSLFEFIFNYACFALKDREDLSEVAQLKSLGEDMRRQYDKLSAHEKFTYETSFGARLVKMSGNPLAYDLFLKLIKPIISMDYMLIAEQGYSDILWIDGQLTGALLDRDPLQACLWGKKRNQRTLEAIGDKFEFQGKKYPVF